MAWSSAFVRAPLKELLAEHQAALQEMREELGDALDDVSLLRYVLSYSTGRVEAARKAIEWRQEHRGLVEAARAREPPPGLSMEDLCALQTLLLAGFHGTTSYGDPIFIIRAGVTNQSAVLDMVGEEKVELWVSYLNECSFQYCEAATRQLSYFVKQISLQDLAGAGMMPDRRYFRIMGRISKTNEWLRPQLLGRVVIFHAPSWASFAFRFAANFLSKKTLSKVWIHPQRPTGAMCPYGQQLLSPETLPSMLGGLCACEGGCIGGWPNDSLQKPSVEAIPSSLSGLLALRRLPRAPAATSPRPTLAPLPVAPPAEASWCRRCCKRRQPLAASVDMA